MSWLAELAIVNSIVAGVLAVVLLLLSRWLRRPALLHALWVLLLVKLVTPAPFHFDIGLSLAGLQQATPATAPSQLPAFREADTASAAETPQLAIGSIAAESGETLVAAKSAGSVLPAEQSPSGAWALLPRSLSLFELMGLVWVAGAVVWFVFQGTRIAQFLWSTKTSSPASSEIQTQCAQLARSMGIARPPRVIVVPAAVSPMLWAFAAPAKLLFPAELMNRLDTSGRATLIAHELAHYRRRDHWIRMLEFVVTGIYWWNPVVWLARKQIEVAEEHCCDAWVVEEFADHPRAYAEALLDTIDFLCEAQPSLPPAASGIGDVPFLRRRLTFIMCESVAKRMTKSNQCVYLAILLTALPLNPGLFANAIRSADPTESLQPLVSTPGETVIEVASAEAQDDVDSNPAQSKATERSMSLPWAVAYGPGQFASVASYTDQSVIYTRQSDGLSIDLTPDGVSTVAFDPHRRGCVTGCEDGRIIFRDGEGNETQAFTAHPTAVRSIHFAPDGSYFVSADREGTVIFWDAGSLEQIISFTTNAGLNCVRVSPDGGKIAVAYGDWRNEGSGGVSIWDVATASQSHDFMGGSSAVATLKYEGDRLLAASWSGELTALDIAEGTATSAGFASKEIVSASRFSADCEPNSLLTRI